jgi:hypothetical protein
MRGRWGVLGWAVLGATLATAPAMAWERPGDARPGDTGPRGYLMPPSRGALMPPSGSYDPRPPQGWHRQPVPYGYRPYGYQPYYGHQPYGYAPRQRQAPALRPPPPSGGVPALPPLR